MSRANPNSVNLGRHRKVCSVCAHPKLEEIDADFVNWVSPSAIVKEFELGSRMSLWRHATAFGLDEKRRKNVRAALEKIIEHAGSVEVTSAAVVAAVQALAKINAQGQWVDRTEHVNLNELFDRMSRDELESYAKDGTLPAWFTQTTGVTASYGEEEDRRD